MKGDTRMQYDEKVLKCFLDNQEKLFPKPVATNEEEADEFLSDVLAVVCNSLDEVWDYFDDTGIDTEGMKKSDIAEADEVFDIGDGRYLVVDA